MIKPAAVPRLPLLGWNYFRFNRKSGGPSILDGSDCVFTSSGRAAILLGLEALGVGEGDRILVPTYHCPTMVAPIISLDAVPVFYPIESTGMPCFDFLEAEAINGVKAILVPHYFGLPQNLQKVRDYCDRNNIAFIEDCAHGFFGSSGDRAIGHFGDVSIASLTKFFPVPSGGVLAISRGKKLALPSLKTPSLMQEAKALLDILETAVSYGRLGGLTMLLGAIFSIKRSLRHRPTADEAAPCYSDSVVPEAMKFDVALARQASEVVCRWVTHLSRSSGIVERRRANYRRLVEELSGREGFSPLFPVLPDGAVPYVFPLRVKNPDAKYRQLKESGLPVFRWNWLWPGTPVIDGDVGIRWSSEVFQLACHQDLSDDELSCIAKTVVEICGEPRDSHQ